MFRLPGFRNFLPIVALPALLGLMQLPVQADPVLITSTVSPDSGNYLYDFAVTNLSSSDPYAKLINFSFSLPMGSILGDPAAPTGYGAFADPSSGYVQFSAVDISGFPLNERVDGFQFLSPTQFGALSFAAAYLDSTETTATPFAGTTSPVPTSSVPEPQIVGLFAVASLLLVCRFGLTSRN